jgi:ketosteroid isomerase-like protein
MHARIAVAAAALVVAACKPQPETAEQANARMSAEGDSVKAQLEAMAATYARQMMGGHTDSLAMFYADNAVMMAPNMPTATGKENIRQALAGMFAQGAPTNVVLRVESVSANGPIAVERGRYSMVMGPVSDSGKYLIHWHRINGEWKMVEEMWNSDLPAAPQPPARRS